MIYIAIRMLVGDRLKYYGLVAGLAFASFLINQQASIFMGFVDRTKSWIRDTNCADLWVMSTQVEFSEDHKVISDKSLSLVRGTKGVKWGVPMYKDYLQLKLPDSSTINVRVIGIDDSTLVGGPAQMVQGKLSDLRRDKGLLVDQDELSTTLAYKGKRTCVSSLTKLQTSEESLEKCQLDSSHMTSLKVGDRVSINDQDAVIVGTFRRTKEFFWEPVVYTTYSRALQFAPIERQMLTYVLVKVQDTFTKNEVAKAIKGRTGLQVLTGPEYESLTMWFIITRTGILVNFGITVFLGLVIGILVSGQLFYTFVLDNLRHFAALKAMGVTSKKLKTMVYCQILMVGTIGYGIGLGVATIVGILSADGALAFSMTWHIPVFSFVAIGLCCLFASSVSLRRLSRVDTAIVFKG